LRRRPPERGDGLCDGEWSQDQTASRKPWLNHDVTYYRRELRNFTSDPILADEHELRIGDSIIQHGSRTASKSVSADAEFETNVARLLLESRKLWLRAINGWPASCGKRKEESKDYCGIDFCSNQPNNNTSMNSR
jgi:hypothetical protein